MSERNDGGPAFPREDYQTDNAPGQEGMSLRDYFAAKAMQGLVASGPHDCEPEGLAHDAYLHADAMLAERERDMTDYDIYQDVERLRALALDAVGSEPQMRLGE